ncbi:MAG: ACP S-malonyltransferase [Candidatus Dadabacteria bacterium]|nr:ACP S-malonyltransferase [Candidatus Dadabacteria bacterium]NIQ13971.1 ACP S-malonyltransferase [Candidatus Dadabacteria bacterium]
MIAFLFPGQGSQYVGMGKEFYSEFAVAKNTFDEASESIGVDVAKLCFDGDQQTLSLTANAQPAILTASISILRVLFQETDLKPDYVAGHSLGEYSALVASGCLNLKDAVYVVRKRGEFMQDAVPVGVGSMAAILGLSSSEVDQICSDVSTDGNIVSPANYNSPVQIVISGNKEAVESASKLAKDKGARRVVPLEVSAPFHCKLMEPAAEKLASVLDEITFSNIKYPVVTNVEAKFNANEDRVKDLLVEQVVSPVRWTDSVNLLANSDVKDYIEIGPGNVLTGLVKRTIKDVNLKNIEKLEQLNHINGDENENGT